MKRFIVTALALLGLAGAQPAMAGVDINIGIGIPGVVYTTPNHPRHGHYHRHHDRYAPGVIVTQPRVVIVPGGVSYYGDRERRHYKKHNRHDRRHWNDRRGKGRDKHGRYRD